MQNNERHPHKKPLPTTTVADELGHKENIGDKVLKVEDLKNTDEYECESCKL